MKRDAPIAALVEKIEIVRDDASLNLLLASIRDRAARQAVRIAFVNAHAVNMCYRDRDFLNDLLACDHVLRDGSGMKLLYKFLKKDPGLNLNGTDLIPRILALYSGSAAALLGTAQPYLGKASEKIAAMGVETPLILDGFQPDAAYADALRAQPVPLVVLAMGMPKQERVAALIAAGHAPCLVLCGGAILDFLGEKVTRAPALFRKTGMEWFYRLALEPKRLFRRYLIGNVVFVFRSLRFAKLSDK